MMHSFGTAVAYLKPNRISKMELSTKVVNGFKVAPIFATR